MASPKTKPTPARRPRSTRKAPAKTAARARPARGGRKPAPARANGLPSWGDLSSEKGAATPRASPPKRGLVEGVPTLRFALYVVTACLLLTLYVGHVYSTQALAAEVQQLQRENHRLVLKHNRLRAAFDRMTAPSVILHRAEALGLAPGSDYGPTIRPEMP